MNISFCKEMRKKNWVIFKLVSRQFILQSVQDQTLQTFPCFLNQSFWTHCPCLKFEEFFSTFHLFVYKNSEMLVLHTLILAPPSYDRKCLTSRRYKHFILQKLILDTLLNLFFAQFSSSTIVHKWIKFKYKN